MPFSLSLSLGILTVEAVLALNNKDAERPPLTFVFSAVSEPGALLQPP
jgi:hypothetical protein